MTRINLAEFPRQAWVVIAFLTFVSTLIGYGVFTWLNTKVSNTLANTYNYVSPAIALGLAALLLKEPLTWTNSGICGSGTRWRSADG
ncbi:EamA family transporter [Nostoc sp.]|uniref:EamA family transporter n=1 Tax=Nostoc sp. TaxID=1180 RepID=UPI003FA5E267